MKGRKKEKENKKEDSTRGKKGCGCLIVSIASSKMFMRGYVIIALVWYTCTSTTSCSEQQVPWQSYFCVLHHQ